MYAKPEINKWCCNTSQTFLPCLHCVSILPRGVCSVGGLHFHQHTVISVLSSFPLFIMGVPNCIKSSVSKNGVQTKENTDMRMERTATQWRANVSGQALPDPLLVTCSSIPLLHQEMLQAGRRALSSQCECCEGTSLCPGWRNLPHSSWAREGDVLKAAEGSTWRVILCSEQACWFGDNTNHLLCCKWNQKQAKSSYRGCTDPT